MTKICIPYEAVVIVKRSLDRYKMPVTIYAGRCEEVKDLNMYERFQTYTFVMNKTGFGNQKIKSADNELAKNLLTQRSSVLVAQHIDKNNLMKFVINELNRTKAKKNNITIGGDIHEDSIHR